MNWIKSLTCSFLYLHESQDFIFLKIMLFVGYSAEMPKWTNPTELITLCGLRSLPQRIGEPRYVSSGFQSESQVVMTLWLCWLSFSPDSSFLPVYGLLLSFWFGIPSVLAIIGNWGLYSGKWVMEIYSLPGETHVLGL